MYYSAVELPTALQQQAIELFNYGTKRILGAPLLPLTGISPISIKNQFIQ